VQVMDVKKKYFGEKKKRLDDLYKNNILKKRQQLALVIDREVYTGGGFKVTSNPLLQQNAPPNM
jgi:hypothetical protein